MKKKLEFIVLGKPFGKQNMRPIRIGNHLSLCRPNETNDYMWKVQSAYIREFGEELAFGIDIPIKLTIDAFYPLNKQDYKKNGELTKNGQRKVDFKVFPTKKPDLDNISKIICDSLNGLCWHDDSQIVCESLSKQYAEQPFVKIIVENIDNEENGVI